MARPKKIIEEQVVNDVTFDFFKQEVEKEGVRIMSAGEVEDPEPNYSGSFNLDYDLVIPFPEGRIIEVYGEEGTCKTTLVLEVLGRACQKGKRCLYVNMEKNLNLSLMQTIRSLRPFLSQALANVEAVGIQEKPPFPDCPLWIAKATNGELALETMRKFASMVPNGVAALDSVDAAQPSAVLAGEIGEQKIGNLAKLLSDAMHKCIDVAELHKVTLIFINQIRQKITMYGDPNTTPGGLAIKFYASQRIQLKKPKKDDFIFDATGEKIGLLIKYLIVKNKLAPDGNEGVFPILLKNGIFREQELVTQCCNFGILKFGGKGGKQVYLPKVDRKNGVLLEESMCMSQFNAARRLLLDPQLTELLNTKLQECLQPGRNDAVDQFITDEIQDISE